MTKTHKPPSYVPQSVMLGGTFVWHGKNEHLGPFETETKLMRKFYGINSSGCFCLASGILTWGAYRLIRHAKVDTAFELADAALAFMADPSSINLDQILEEKVPNSPAPLSAFRELRWCAMGCILPGRWVDNIVQPTRDLFHLAFLVRYLLKPADRKLFDLWLDTVTVRIRALAPRPNKEETVRPKNGNPQEIAYYMAKFWGAPVPRKILEQDLPPADLKTAFLSEIAGIDWTKNQYILRQPNFQDPFGGYAK